MAYSLHYRHPLNTHHLIDSRRICQQTDYYLFIITRKTGNCAMTDLSHTYIC